VDGIEPKTDLPAVDLTAAESTMADLIKADLTAAGDSSLRDRGRTAPGRAHANSSPNVTRTGKGAVRGGLFRSIPIVGPLVGAFLGRRSTDHAETSNQLKATDQPKSVDHLRRESYRTARRAYESAVSSAKSAEDESMRKTYRRYREVALEQAAVFRSQIEDFLLPTESSAIKDMAASIRRAAQDDYQSECQAVRMAAEAAAKDRPDAWLYTMLGLGTSRGAERLLAG
jgi:hypothetical protein